MRCRLLGKGRDRLANANLYSYEAGAIYENQRDYPHAVDEYVKGALSAPELIGGTPATAVGAPPEVPRSDRSAHSQDRCVPPNAAMPAVYLACESVRGAEPQTGNGNFLDSLANGTTSIEQAEEIETLAQQKSLETVRQHALEKQAALTTDPVTRLQLRYALIRLYESRKDFPAAQKNVEALYRENPRVLGVVRSTVDFYWRMKMQTQAISVLLQAAKMPTPV
jgi:cellulose synthase operon protein C